MLTETVRVDRISGRGLSEEKVRRAIELAGTRYCSTLTTLREAWRSWKRQPDEGGGEDGC